MLRSALCAIVVFFAVSSPKSTWAWGSVGHQAIAYIAEDRLSPATKAKVQELLGSNVTLSDVANWADVVRSIGRPETAHWHFIDIAHRENVTRADIPKFCVNQDCVVGQLDAEILVLKDPKGSAYQKREALKFLVHFIGDVHQPLHCADDHDRGGNDKFVRVVRQGGRGRGGTRIKLHAYWDHLLQLKAKEDPRALATELEKKFTAVQATTWSKGAPADWAWESYQIARTNIYSAFLPGPSEPEGVPLPADYNTPKMRQVVDVQLERAGVRLAFVLNTIFVK
jgi:hypothetical protein